MGQPGIAARCRRRDVSRASGCAPGKKRFLWQRRRGLQLLRAARGGCRTWSASAQPARYAVGAGRSCTQQAEASGRSEVKAMLLAWLRNRAQKSQVFIGSCTEQEQQPGTLWVGQAGAEPVIVALSSGGRGQAIGRSAGDREGHPRRQSLVQQEACHIAAHHYRDRICPAQWRRTTSGICTARAFVA